MQAIQIPLLPVKNWGTRTRLETPFTRAFAQMENDHDITQEEADTFGAGPCARPFWTETCRRAVTWPGKAQDLLKDPACP